MTVALYLSRQIGLRILAVALAFLALAIGVDLLDNSTEIIDIYGGAGLGEYALLRAPLILVTILPLCVLFGAALAFLSLALKSEMVILRAAGFNTLGVIVRLLPLAVLLGAVQSQLASAVGPAAERQLAARFPALFDVQEIVEDVWLRDRRAVIRIGRATANGNELGAVTIFQTDPHGTLLLRIDAARAIYAVGGWRLENVTLQPWNGPKQKRAEMEWATSLAPVGILEAARRPELVDTAEIRGVLAGVLPGARGTPFYAVQLWRSYAAYAVPVVMFLFAALASFGLGRGGGGARHAVMAVAGGALFVLFDGVCTSLGEVGAIGAVPAAFLAPGLFLLIGLWSIVVVEE